MKLKYICRKPFVYKDNKNKKLMNQQIKDLEKECSQWQKKYHSLLQKNQNDLIKIRLRQKQLNDTIEKLQIEKEQLKNYYENKIKLLQQQISILNTKIHLQIQDKTQQKITIKPTFELTKINQQLQKQKTTKDQLQLKIFNLKKLVSKFQLQKIKADQQLNHQKLKFQNFEKQILNLGLNQQKKQVQNNKKIDFLQSEIQKLRELLQLSKEQYKNLLCNQQMKDEVIKTKNQQLNEINQQYIIIKQKFEQLRDLQKYKNMYLEGQRKNQELEQDNTLMKEIIKSHKTIIKIKLNQIEQLKSKIPQNQDLKIN